MIPANFKKEFFYSKDVPLGGVNPNAMLATQHDHKHANYDAFAYHVFNPERYALRKLHDAVRANREYLQQASETLIHVQARVIHLCHTIGMNEAEPRSLEAPGATSDTANLPDRSQQGDLCGHFPPKVDSGTLERLVNENRQGCTDLKYHVGLNHAFLVRMRSVTLSASKHLSECKEKIASRSQAFDGRIDYDFARYHLPNYPNIENQAGGSSRELLEESTCDVDIHKAAQVLRPIHKTIDKLVDIVIRNREEVRYMAGRLNALFLAIGWLERYHNEKELRLAKNHIIAVLDSLTPFINSGVNELIDRIIASFETAYLEDPNLDDETVEELINLVHQKRSEANQVFSKKNAETLKTKIYGIDGVPKKTLFAPHRVYRIALTNSSDLEGYEISTHAYRKKDIKAKSSVYASAHKKYRHNNTLFLVTRDNGESYQIILTFDEKYHLTEREINQTGWGLSLLRGNGANRSECSTYATFCKNPSKNSRWKFTRLENSKHFTISLAEDENGTNQKGWELCVHRCFNGDIRDDYSTYIIGHAPASDRQNNRWKIL